MISGNILRIQNGRCAETLIPKLQLSKSECINITDSPNEFRSAMVECLLMKDSECTGIELFGTSLDMLEPKDRQSLRRRLSYWPSDHEHLIDEKFLKLKRAMMGNGKGSSEQTAKLFLDHLMIGNSMTSKYKRLCFSLLMNAPELLIIDQSLDVLPDEMARSLLSVFTRYSEKSGMALLNFTQSKSVVSLLNGRQFVIDNGSLVETVID